MKKVLNIREPNVYARLLEAEVLHPLISVVHFDELENGVRTSMNNLRGLWVVHPAGVSAELVVRRAACAGEQLVGDCRCTGTDRR